MLIARLIEYDRNERATKNADKAEEKVCGVPPICKKQMQEYVDLKHTMLKRYSHDILFKLCASNGLHLAKSTSKHDLSRKLIKNLTKKFTVIPSDFCDYQADRNLVMEVERKSKK